MLPLASGLNCSAAGSALPFFRADLFDGGGDGCSAGEAARFFLVAGGIVAVMHGFSAPDGLACF